MDAKGACGVYEWPHATQVKVGLASDWIATGQLGIPDAGAHP